MKERRTLLVEGWRFIPHSYAIVNQFQCLELLKRPEIRLLHRDVPFCRNNWRRVPHSMDAKAEALVAAIPPPAPNDQIDAVYRIAFPYNFSPSEAKRTCVLGASEFGQIGPRHTLGHRPLVEALAGSDTVVITPSNWSRNGFLANGADPNRVVVIPHGIDPQIFHPISEEQRQAQRQKYKWDGFVFLSVGSMTGNKGMRLLLKAFAAVAARHPQSKLMLKGLDAFFGSQELLAKNTGADLTPDDLALIRPRMHYQGGILPIEEVALLYQMADAYVAPYFGEGFALPVLEAIACGCPVICTGGGSTDDFTNADVALRIESHLKSVPSHAEQGETLTMQVPDMDSLIRQMLTVIEQPAYAARARSAGPKFVNENFTWKLVVDRLLEVLFPD
jgi:glycosyltransferase involved in cell wall biosynthesis